MKGVLVGLVSLIAAVGLAVAGYALGSAAAPDEAAWRATRNEAYQQAYQASASEAHKRSAVQGQDQGAVRGRTQGSRVGTRTGSTQGREKAEAQLATVEAQQAAATPEAACQSLIGDPGAYGTCLEQEGQDPGAPLTAYCNAHPEIVAQAGFCPSLNE